MKNSIESEEAVSTEEVQIIGELVRSSNNAVVRTTQLPTIYTSQLLQQQQKERISAPSFGMSSTLSNCLNITKSLIELQNLNTSLIAQLESERTTKANLEAEVKTVNTKLQDVQQQKDFQQTTHLEAMNTANNQTTEARRKENIWKDNYNNCKKAFDELKIQFIKEQNRRKNMQVSAQNLKGKFQGKVEDLNKLQEQMNAKRNQYEKASSDLKGAIENKNKLEMDKDKLLEKDINSQSNIIRLNNENEELRSTITRQSATIYSNSSQIAKLSTELNLVKNDTNANAAKLAKAEAELIEANKEIRRLKQENRNLVDTLDSITSKIQFNYRETNSVTQEFGLGNQENESLPMRLKRGSQNMGDAGCSESSKKKRYDNIPKSSDSHDDKDPNTGEDNQDSMVVPQPQYDAELVAAGSSTLNRNCSFSETIEINQDGDEDDNPEYYDKFKKLRRNNL